LNKEKLNLKIGRDAFLDFVLGTLIYAVVLGFFEDYTNILTTWSYSATFFAAVVMQVLTQATFWLKSFVINYFKGKEGRKYVVILIFFVWLILFISKFVFLAVIDFIFGGNVEISGFIGLLIIILTMTGIKKLIDQVYSKLD
jgi:hypothetical protein